MAGAYCKFCDRRCFVYRVLPDGRGLHLATCPRGMEHDRKACGHDHRTAKNPHAPAPRGGPAMTDPDHRERARELLRLANFGDDFDTHWVIDLIGTDPPIAIDYYEPGEDSARKDHASAVNWLASALADAERRGIEGLCKPSHPCKRVAHQCGCGRHTTYTYDDYEAALRALAAKGGEA